MAEKRKHHRKDLGLVPCVEGLAVGSGSLRRGFSAKFGRNYRGSRSDFFGPKKRRRATPGDAEK